MTKEDLSNIHVEGTIEGFSDAFRELTGEDLPDTVVQWLNGDDDPEVKAERFRTYGFHLIAALAIKKVQEQHNFSS